MRNIDQVCQAAPASFNLWRNLEFKVIYHLFLFHVNCSKTHLIYIIMTEYILMTTGHTSTFTHGWKYLACSITWAWKYMVQSHKSVCTQWCFEYEQSGFLVVFEFPVWVVGEEKGVVHFSPPAWCLNSGKWMWQWGPWAAADSLGLAVWPCMCVCLWVCLHVPPCLCVHTRMEVEHIWDDSWTLLGQARDSSDCYTHSGGGTETRGNKLIRVVVAVSGSCNVLTCPTQCRTIMCVVLIVIVQREGCWFVQVNSLSLQNIREDGF